MKDIPETQHATVLRTGFLNDKVWQTVCTAIEKPIGEFKASVTFVSDPVFEGLTIDEVVQQTKKDRSFIFIVDNMTISHREHPILVVDLFDEPGQTFRVIPSEMWSVENNLSIANMSFREFVDHIDDHGIFRGF